jgi:hypothetical protein
MLTPIPPSELFAMLATGGPPALTLGLGVQSINGLRNWSPDARGSEQVDAAFVEVLQLLGELRDDGILGFRFEAEGGRRTAYLLLEDPDDKKPLDARAERLLDLLDLDPGMTDIPIRFGFGTGDAGEIRIYTRSVLRFWTISPPRSRSRAPMSRLAEPMLPRRAPPRLPCCRACRCRHVPSGRWVRSSPSSTAAPGTGSTIATTTPSVCSASCCC